MVRGPVVGMPDPDLGDREVLDLVARGETNKQIALRLYLLPRTIKLHTCSAYRKLSARNRAEAVTRARALGFIV